MVKSKKAVVLFNEVGRNDVGLVGGKGANLGEMTNAGIPVPPGFIVTAAAYFDFIEEAKLHDKIKTLLEPLDVHDSRQLQNIAAMVQKLIGYPSRKLMPPRMEASTFCPTPVLSRTKRAASTP